MTAERAGTNWTAQDDEMLMRCVKQGETLDHTKKVLERSASAVLARLEQMVTSENRWRELTAQARKVLP